ncbi:phosphatase [Paractinoplanes abujensis]|uniref:Putative metal-dependent phosphoesterase TrpH n=1 Tax=Paractinoplanes abujensis TaxID=882441 RepID=A0A7W7G774_9ACTN|nr:PHP domain-containing protein [Actinoplanes abujensis]MBB4696671.1 putative metal-dependent phosphoesterase TrpH [Actinoplanes abujensis]GID18865.1 phosphatase [Actinoplanes abujensis]
MTRIDLHCHSTASDGTLTPAELVKAGAVAGLDVMAITDHDTTGGWQAAAEARPEGLRLVRGAELSCRWHGAEQWPIALHLLAYLFDPAEPRLAADLARLRTDREQRAEKIVRKLAADGVPITWDEVFGYARGGSVGRPHIAQALIRAGLVRTTNEAFASRWLGARYFVPKADLDVFEAVRAVRAAGGVAVFAHPRATVRGRVVPDRLIVELAEAGLFGLEADHEDHSPVEREHVRALAGDLGLVVTGSSDFHGTHKTVQLGDFTTAPEAYDKIVSAATGVPVLG